MEAGLKEKKDRSQQETKRHCIPIGFSVRLVPAGSLAEELRIDEASTLQILWALGVPTIQFPPNPTVYLSLFTLEMVLFYLLRPGNRGWTSTDYDSDKSRCSLVEAANHPEVVELMRAAGSLYRGQAKADVLEKCRRMVQAFDRKVEGEVKRKLTQSRWKHYNEEGQIWPTVK